MTRKEELECIVEFINKVIPGHQLDYAYGGVRLNNADNMNVLPRTGTTEQTALCRAYLAGLEAKK